MTILDALVHPIVLAPLGGGPSTPALTAAVSDAGGLGFLAAGYQSPEATRESIEEVRRLTPAPFGVNLFVPQDREPDAVAVEAYVRRLRDEATRYGVEPGVPRNDDDGWSAKLELLLTSPVPVVSFTFGCPPPDIVDALRRAGSEVWVTVTSVAEARLAREAGADVLVLQGVEAGGHRACFDDRDDAGLGILPLLRLVAAESDLPLVAAGGIGDGPAIAGVLAAGASAAQLGSAFLLADEAGTHPAHRAALREGRSTALTRAFTGRLARGIENRFMREHAGEAPPAYPHLHYATAPLRAAARERGDAEAFNLWAGEAHHLAVEGPAGDIVRTLSERASEALAVAQQRRAAGAPPGSA